MVVNELRDRHPELGRKALDELTAELFEMFGKAKKELED